MLQNSTKNLAKPFQNQSFCKKNIKNFSSISSIAAFAHSVYKFLKKKQKMLIDCQYPVLFLHPNGHFVPKNPAKIV
jgi:hypothetical protein